LDISEKWEKLKNLLFVRQQAYQQTFNPNSQSSDRVLRDLAKFCRANEPTFHQDPRAHALMEGRREVWLRIQHHLKLDSEMLWKHYGRKEE